MSTQFDRRAFLGLTGLTGAAFATGAVHPGEAEAAPDTSRIEKALRRFDDLPGKVAFMIRVGRPGRRWEIAKRANQSMFVGSAIKTFILTRYLKDVESGREDPSRLLKVDDGVRSVSSPVLLNLTGKTPGTSILEAMITHSDNTATDVALQRVGVDRVRTFVANAGLETVRIPTSTRMLFSYLAGAPYGEDVGWEGAQQIENGHLFGKARSPMNERETMQASAADFVSYYERAMAGEFIRSPAILTEFRRISSMASTLWQVVPENTPAYGKGGSIEWRDFNCLCLPGQMLLGGVVPVTFCFCVNWKGKPETIPVVTAQFGSAINSTLAQTAKTFG